MGKVTAILQNKGGVGKTTVSCNLGAAYAKRFPDRKVLIIDADPQGNQALSFGIQPNELENALYDVLVNDLPVMDAIVPIKYCSNLYLLPANDDMNYYELDTLPGMADVREYLLTLRKAIEPVLDDFDRIIIDSPPELKIIAASIMMVADEIYIPFEPDAYNAQGLIQLLEKIEVYKEQYDTSPEVKGIIPMKVKKKTLLHRGVLTQVDAFCNLKGIKVMNTKIPDSIRYPEFIASARMPIVLADPNGDHAKYYFKLLDEVLQNG
ncbi:ParA family protein [Hazenella sp. IB182357]|uniref:ParA family protein n=1 Tax=Polycladospora coralii TaxID=2771432 RepID=A0A926NCC1_9BACL|nr:ParA family protein [Polycladospora coralii]MBD1373972.1 ParA family protein [Polycladospora coralii]